MIALFLLGGLLLVVALVIGSIALLVAIVRAGVHGYRRRRKQVHDAKTIVSSLESKQFDRIVATEWPTSNYGV